MRPAVPLALLMRAAKETGSLMPPKHILNAPTGLMKDLGYGAGYSYDHNAEDGFSGQDYFPEDIARQNFYQPVERGFEREISKRLEYWDKFAGHSVALRIQNHDKQADFAGPRCDVNMILAIACGGAIGAVGRHFVNVGTVVLLGTGFPWATLTVNVVGSFLMGALVHVFAVSWPVSMEMRALLTVGGLGAFTNLFDVFAGCGVAL